MILLASALATGQGVNPTKAKSGATQASASVALKALLTEFLDGAGRNDAAIHNKFWADDLIYTGSGGVRRTKADIMKGVSSAPPPKPDDPKVTYSAEDIQIHQYGNTAVLAFRLVGRTEKDGKVETAYYLNTGTFVKRNGRWQAVAWQATKQAEPAAK
ncbi:MAG: nuclear transport factor 2 family protein [Acidobacteriales bacterium]|nr:nuclear transport factor 2 family protein [Terriglobales bacterium]